MGYGDGTKLALGVQGWHRGGIGGPWGGIEVVVGVCGVHGVCEVAQRWYWGAMECGDGTEVAFGGLWVLGGGWLGVGLGSGGAPTCRQICA